MGWGTQTLAGYAEERAAIRNLSSIRANAAGV
jgi:hypothetical protein